MYVMALGRVSPRRICINFESGMRILAVKYVLDRHRILREWDQHAQ